MFIKANHKLLEKQWIFDTSTSSETFFFSNLTNFKSMVILSVGEISTCILIIKSTCVV